LKGGDCLPQPEKGKSRSTDVAGHDGGGGVAASNNRPTALNSRRLAAQKIAETTIFGGLALPSEAGGIQQDQEHEESLWGKNGLVGLQGFSAESPKQSQAPPGASGTKSDSMIVRDRPVAGPSGASPSLMHQWAFMRLLNGVTTVLGFTISRDKRYRLHGLPQFCQACALFDV
jgi:hypothetical protein